MNRLKQEFRVRGFSIEVNGTFVLSSFENSSIQSTDACEDRVSCFIELLYHLVGCEIPLFLLIVTIFAVKPRPPARVTHVPFFVNAAELKRFRSHSLAQQSPGDEQEK